MEQKINTLLTSLREKNIKLTLKKNNIEVNSYGTKLPVDLIKEIKLHKNELIEYLSGETSQDLLSISKSDVYENYPLSSSQKRLWILSQFNENYSVYNVSDYQVLEKGCNITNFKKAIRAVIDRHEILRTVFREDLNGEIKQWIISKEEFDFNVETIDLTNEEDPIENVNKYFKEDLFRPFDLSNGPLFRLCLFKLSEDNYALYYCMHHIICDEWSKNVLIKDILAFYKGFQGGPKVYIPELTLQYKDYAVWQSNALNTNVYKEHKKYWLKKLSGEIPIVDLPTQKIRPKTFSNKGRRIRMYIDPENTARLKTFCKEQEGSLFIGILAIWKVLFYRYTSQNDLIIGTSSADRAFSELDNQIGFYVNSIPLRNQLDIEESFKDFFQKVKESTFSDFSHQNYPIDELIDELNVNRDPSRNILFDVFITLLNIEESEQKSNIDTDLIKDLGETFAKFDLDIKIIEIGETLCFDLIYCDDVYDYTIIKQFLSHYKELVDVLIQNPEKRISECCFLNEKEREQLTFEFNQKNAKYPINKTVIDLFKEQVCKKPNNSALVFNDKRITFKELDQKSNQLANCLQVNYGVGQGDIVGMHLDRSEWSVISILAILKVGAAYLPIDPDLPNMRKEHMLNDANIEVLITQIFYINYIDYYDNEILIIDSGLNLDDFKTNFSSESSNVNNLAYIIYTSGSTGTPKGVMIEHKSLFNSTLARNDYYSNLNSFLLVPSFSFDSSVAVIWNSLTTGSELHIISNETLKDPNQTIDKIVKHSIEGMLCVPSFYKFLMNEDSFREAKLKRVVLAGEYLPENLVKSHFEMFEECTLFNEYGPTENTVWASVAQIHPDFTNITIGSPIVNTQVYILNEKEQLSPIGVIGEIYIGGKNLSKGYLNQPQLTSEKFINSPFNQDEVLYKTGDIGRWLDDGNIEFIGRIDDQVKIRGFRIELGEIEHQLRSINYVDGAVVLPRDNEDGGKELIGYVTTTKELNTSELRKDLLEFLPNYMIPSRFVLLKEIPLTKNGKVDKKALEANDTKEIDSGVEYVAPKTIIEKEFIEVLESVLKKEKISVKDNFYNLGGDSIKSILIISHLKQKGYKLKISDILRFPIIEELSKLIVEDNHIVVQDEVVGQVELTPIQSYFFKSSSINNVNHYNQSVVLKTAEKIDNNALDQCIEFLTNHHDALRMVFKYKNLKWQQYNQEIEGKYYTLEFHNLEEEENPLEVMEKVGTRLQKSFNIEEGPLVKVIHFRMKDGDRIAIIIHHLIIDGVSWRILLEDLKTLYDQVKSKLPFSLPLKTNSFQNWALSLKQYASEIKPEEIDYWKKLQGETVSNIPIEKLISEQPQEKKRVNFTLSKAITDRLQTKFHHVFGTDINEALLAGLALAIKDIYDIDRSVIEMEGHGREDIADKIDISRTVGWFTSVYPVILNISNTNEVRDALIKVKETMRKIPQKGIGYGILKHLTNDFDDDIKPKISFNFLGDFGSNNNEKDQSSVFELSSEYIGEGSDEANIDNSMLEVSGLIIGDRLRMVIQYSTANYSNQIIDELIKSYEKNLINLIDTIILEKESYLTPSDLTFKGLKIEELKEINSNNDVEDIYRLSPLQEGMYYHWLSGNSSEMYFTQTSYRVRIPNIDLGIIEKAYGELISRYAILRTKFTTKYAGLPLQIVYKNVNNTLHYEKVPSNLNENEIEEHINLVKKTNRNKGFNLNEPSQIHLQLFEIKKGEYEFVWSHHHILMDGWCSSILINDFYLLMNSIHNGTEPNLTIPKKYSTYINWLDNIDKNASINYWKNYLKDYQSTAELPFKKNNEHLESEENDLILLKIKGDLHNKVSTYCSRIGITLNSFFQGVWGFLLSKYNNTNDVVFGAVVSGRPSELEGISEMIGLFINTIPVRLQYDDSSKPEEFLKNHNERSIESTPYHYMNLSELQSLTQMGAKLVDHIMVFENYYVQESSQDTNFDSNENEFSAEFSNVFELSNYDFHIVIAPHTSEIGIEFKFDPKIYSKEEINVCATHYYELISKFCSVNEESLGELEYLSEIEKNNVLYKFNNTKVDFLKERNIINVFEDQVAIHKDQPCLIYGEKEYSYSEFNNCVNKISNYLIQEKNISIGDVVAVEMKDRVDLSIIAIFAVLKSGGTYVVIDSDYPKNRLDFILQDSSSKVFLKTDDILKLSETSNNQVFNNPNLNINSENLAYIIYTSGTTGSPKGVQIRHKSIVNYFNWFTNKFQFSSNDKVILTSSITYDLIYTSLYGAMLNGAPIHIVDEQIRKSPLKTLEYIEKNDITFLKLTPTYLNILLAHKGGFSLINSRTVRLIFAGGEHQNPDDVKKIILNSDIRLVNHYGHTETTIGMCTLEITKENLNSFLNRPTIGYPNNNNIILILGTDNKLKPIGVVGEICVGGYGLSTGYLNRPELNKEKFIQDPYNEGQLLYKSGDLGKRLVDGSIELIGRKDDQIKVNGYRVEIGEIEYHLNSNVNIVDSAVKVMRVNSDANEIVAYLTSNEKIDVGEIREYLLERVPNYMVPTYFVHLDSLPITPNGKIDKKNLPNPNGLGLSSNVNYCAPRNEKERLLIDVWIKVLKQDTIGVKDNFYDLGGNSLKSLRIISELNLLGYDLDIRMLLTKPRVEDLAPLLTTISLTGSIPTEYVKKIKIGDKLALSNNQLRFFRRKYSQVGIPIKLSNLDVDTFETNFRKFLSKLPVLCVKYSMEGTEIVQEYVSSNNVNLDIRVLNQIELEDDSKLDFLNEPFKLLGGSLIRVAIISHKDIKDDIEIYVAIHHSLVDAYTSSLIMKEFRVFIKTNKFSDTKYTSYFDFVRWQEQYLNSKNGRKEREYWIKLLRNIPTYPEIKNVEIEVTGFVEQKIIISGEKLQYFKDKASRMKVPLSAVFLGHYHLLLNKLNLNDKFLVGVIVNGREQKIEGIEVDKLLGVMDNLLPTPIEKSEYKLEEELIHKVYMDYVSSRNYQKIPYLTIKSDIQENYQKNIDNYMIGNFNFQVRENSILNDKENGVDFEYVNNKYARNGVHLTCIVHSNAIEIYLSSLQHVYESEMQVLNLQNFIDNI